MEQDPIRQQGVVPPFQTYVPNSSVNICLGCGRLLSERIEI